MNTIIAGMFQQQPTVDEAADALLHAGFPRASIATFFVNPPGQHAAHPLGGDHLESAGAHASRKGIVKGAATGAAVGAVATAFLGPTGALLGAHVGGLVGSLSEMKEHGETGAQGEDADNTVPVRASGLLLAVDIGDGDENAAVGVLRSFGAEQIERAQGTIVNGDWVDFDPLAAVALVAPLPHPPSASVPRRT